jgi:alpha-tubulin suppressor-like RCC1 family protein
MSHIGYPGANNMTNGFVTKDPWNVGNNNEPGNMETIAALRADGTVVTFGGGRTACLAYTNTNNTCAAWSWQAAAQQRLGYGFTGNAAGNNVLSPASVVSFNDRTVINFGSGVKIADIASEGTVLIALSTTGDVYTWGMDNVNGVFSSNPTGMTSGTSLVDTATTDMSYEGNNANAGPSDGGQTGQGVAMSTTLGPVKILSGVHSIGAGIWNGWAVKSDGVYFWGSNNSAYGGLASGDSSLPSAVLTPTKITSGPLYDAFVAGQAEGDDNATVGVMAGCVESTAGTTSQCGVSAVDNGTFRQFIGNLNTSAVRLRGGQVLEWGSGSYNTAPASAVASCLGGVAATASANPCGTSGGTAIQLASTMNQIFALGTDGHMWQQGSNASAWKFPDASGVAKTSNSGGYSTLTEVNQTCSTGTITDTMNDACYGDITHLAGFGNTLTLTRSVGSLGADGTSGSGMVLNVGGGVYVGGGYASNASGGGDMNGTGAQWGAADNNPFWLVRVTARFAMDNTPSYQNLAQPLNRMYMNAWGCMTDASGMRNRDGYCESAPYSYNS